MFQEYKGSRLIWGQKAIGISSGRSTLEFVKSLIFNKRSGLRLAKILFSNKYYLIITTTFCLYCYFTYLHFTYKIIKKFGPKLYKIIKKKFVYIQRKRTKYVEVIIL